MIHEITASKLLLNISSLTCIFRSKGTGDREKYHSYQLRRIRNWYLFTHYSHIFYDLYEALSNPAPSLPKLASNPYKESKEKQLCTASIAPLAHLIRFQLSFFAPYSSDYHIILLIISSSYH